MLRKHIAPAMKGGKMKTIVMIGIVSILLAQFGAANMYITEVMHSPTQVADSEGEWIEIYNDGSQAVDLSSWTVDGKSIGNKTINSKAYLVLARELVDGVDTDLESFESYWGNNNGIWDESFPAVEVSLSLKTEDTIILTNGVSGDTFTYNTSFGGKNGKTVERISLNEWKEGPIGGTPGAGNFSLTTSTNNGNEIALFIEVLNNLPQILSINITDESEEEGIQIIPLFGQTKEVKVDVLINDSDGLNNVQGVTYSFANSSGNLTLEKNISQTAGWYTGILSLSPELLAGEYSLTVTARDTENETKKEQAFSYEGIVSTQLNVSTFSITMQSGGTETRAVELLNSGNIALDTEISAEDIVSSAGVIPKNSISVFQNVWLPLENPVVLDTNIVPNAKKELQFRIQLPAEVKSGQYEGKIFITSMESESGE